eukprot:scaffold14250_cov89-Skeletonema_dohrnii-CCMP3373.AAC.3
MQMKRSEVRAPPCGIEWSLGSGCNFGLYCEKYVLVFPAVLAISLGRETESSLTAGPTEKLWAYSYHVKRSDTLSRGTKSQMIKMRSTLISREVQPRAPPSRNQSIEDHPLTTINGRDGRPDKHNTR